MLFINMRVPLGDEDTCLVFHRWIPETPDSALVSNAGACEVRIWVDRECLRLPYRYEGDKLNRIQNVEAGHVRVQVRDRSVSDALKAHVCSGKYFGRGEWDHDPLEAEHAELGKRVYESASNAVARLATHARVAKAQYWLPEFRNDRDNRHYFFIRADARVSDDNASWHEFNPPPRHGRLVIRGKDSSRFIDQHDWKEAAVFVESASRPHAVLELLANAERLCGDENGRSALVEAIAALETAIGNFCRSPDRERLAMPASVPFGLEALPGIWRNRGFETMLNLVLPLLLVDGEARTLLPECQTAHHDRNNVVHGAQRTIDTLKVRRQLRSIRALCVILLNATLKPMERARDEEA